MNPIAPFKLERYFAKYEFSARYLLSPSDCESLSMQNLLDTADAECQALWAGLSLGYTESQGHPLLRAEISSMTPGFSPDNIMVFAPEEAIFVAMQSLLQPGDEVITLFPAYQSLYEIARSMACSVKLWKLVPGENGWSLDFDWLEQAVTPRTRLLVVNFPHNPTGFHASRAELDRIVELAARYGTYLLCDEMYRCLDAGLIELWKSWKDYTTICSSAPSEILAITALRQKEKLAARSLGFIQANLQVADSFFKEFAGMFQWSRPQAGSVAFPRLLLDLPVDDFCRQVVEDTSIMLVPGSMFDYPGNHLRLGLGRKNFSEALGILRNYLLDQKAP